MASTINPANVISITDPSEHQAAGAIVFWTLSGNISLDDLEKAWIKAGFDEKLLPGLTPPEPNLPEPVDLPPPEVSLKTQDDREYEHRLAELSRKIALPEKPRPQHEVVVKFPGGREVGAKISKARADEPALRILNGEL